MKVAIIASRKDIAGMNIASFLEKEDLSKYNSKLYLAEKEPIYCENIAKEIEADLFIFATRHQSAKGVHSLSCHCPGNWDIAEAGGKDGELCVAPAVLLKEAFLELNRLGKDMHHEITLEVTHHGPYLEKPCMFIEIGSDEENWRNKESGKVISGVILFLLKNIDQIMKNEKRHRIAFGIGGPHYANTFSRRMLDGNIAIGHICPKHMLNKLDGEMIKQAIQRTNEKADFVLLDWKGLGKEKQRIINLLEELRINYKRTDQIK